MTKYYAALFFFYCVFVSAQVYDDYYGAGHQLGMTITASGSVEGSDAPQNSVSGAMDELTMEEASRFLAQSSLGYTYEEIERVKNMGLETWLNEQINMPISQTFQSKVEELWVDIDPLLTTNFVSNRIVDFAFYENVLKGDDLLRQRMAFAWSQILVVQEPRVSLYRHLGYSKYYDILYGNAFGNFRDMLFDVTMCVPMGSYLSSLRNRKFDPNTGSEPDENFAREIMQLFTIGVHELNINGTVKIDPSNGLPVETYDIEDVAELAKVFTGLGGSKTETGAENANFPRFDSGIDWTEPMKMFQDFHEEGPKNFLSMSIPQGQSGMQDINDAVDYLFEHPNTGPFLATRLIQHLIKSNPSPAYIARVARVFNNNGSGVRGDLEAVTKAIFFDPEARECDYITTSGAGKLIQPVERFIHLLKAFKVTTPSNKLYLSDNFSYNRDLLQGFNNSPSVFNFFQFDYAEENHVDPQGLVSPEFQILNAVTSINYINIVENSLKIRPFNNLTAPGENLLQGNNDDIPILDFSEELQVYNSSGLNGLLDRLNILLCRGQLTSEVRNAIITTINENLANVNNYEPINVVHDCIYYLMISPDYAIQL